MRLRAAGLLTIAVIACGCGSVARQPATSSSKAAAAATPVPWINATPASLLVPTPTPTIPPAGTAACRLSDLVAVFNGIGAMTGGQLAGTILLGNRGDRSCVLQGRPELQLFDSSGRRVQITATQAEGMPSNPVLLLPGTVDVQPHVPRAGIAYVEFEWGTHDGAGNPCIPTPPQATAVSVVLVGNGAIPRLPVSDEMGRWSSIAPCYSRISVSAFQSWPAPDASPSPDPLFALDMTINAPAAAVAGSVLRYTVTLSNTALEPYRFPSACPPYIEWVGNGSAGLAKNVYVLNCAPVAVIQPGQSVAFAMQVQIPAGTMPGKYTLWWAFIGPSESLKTNPHVDLTVR